MFRRSVVIMVSKRINAQNVIFFIVTIVIAYSLQASIRDQTKLSVGYYNESLLNFTELTAVYEYIAEEHDVITDDGYILKLFRISKAKNCHRKKRSPPVLLLHGLLMSSDSWIDAGPDAGLAYLIADACYDLWLGNTRGNCYSRRHVSLNPDKDPEYWQFYYDEHGRFDLPAMIDYVLDYTRAEKVNYIGFSQGSGSFIVMCSERPEYCDKVNLSIGLAPATRVFHTQSGLLRALLHTYGILEGFLSNIGVYEALPKGSFVQEFASFFCPLNRVTVNICTLFMYQLDHVYSYNYGSFTSNTVGVLFRHFPVGTSVKTMAKYSQALNRLHYEKYDYGKEKNLIVYGEEEPPKYNMSAVTVPFVCIYGENDGLVDVKDIEWLVNSLPNVVESYKIKDPLWTHFDDAYSQHIGVSIFPKISEYLSKYSSS